MGEQQQAEHGANEEQPFGHRSVSFVDVRCATLPFMPPRPAIYVAPAYVERLSIKARWWGVVIAVALFGSSELFAGFDGRVIAVVTAAVVLPTVVLLTLASRTVLRIDAGGIHVGS